jgi:alcohol dehydrogenase class IV
MLDQHHHRSFTFELPTRIEFGRGIVARLAERVAELGGTRVLLVTDPGLVAAGIADRLTAVLDDAKVDFTLFTDVEPEPEAGGVHAGAQRCRDEGCDRGVALGGGSAQDTGKAIALMVSNPGHIRDYAGLGVPMRPGLPTIAVPTTAGTGSEVAIWAVISEKERNDKYGIGGRGMTADIALCDPELTVTLPPRLTAVTGMDALAHALESYVNKATQPISEALSEKAMQLVSRSLRAAVWRGDQIGPRADMLLASTIAAAAFNCTRLGLAHALAMPLGAEAKIPHGDLMAILLPEVMRFNFVADLDKFARIAALFGEPVEGLSPRAAAQAGVEAVDRLAVDIAAPRGLGAYGVTEDDLPGLAEEGIRSGNVAVNPRSATADDLVGIMRRCL